MSRHTSPVPPPEETAPSPRPLRADAARNRQRIIAAAREVFAERGLDVTLDDIAHHAGVGVGTVYRRFADREELVEAVFESEIQCIVAVAEEALTHEDPWDGLTHLFMTTCQGLADNRGLREVLLQGTHGKAQVAAARDNIAPAIGAVIARAQQHGALRDDIEPSDFPLIQMMLGSAMQHTRDVAPDLWQRYLALILDGLRTDREPLSALPHRALTAAEFDRCVS